MSNEPSIEKMNEAIALFDDFKYDTNGYCGVGKQRDPNAFPYAAYKPIHMKYHTSWDWLMPVVEKIESIENKRFGVCIDVLDTMIMDYNVGYDQGEKIVVQTDIYPDNGDTKISITQAAVYQFITWLNQQKNDTE